MRHIETTTSLSSNESMDYDSLYGHGRRSSTAHQFALEERLQMQAEMHRLRMQLAHANKRAENFEEQLLKLQQAQPTSTKPSELTTDLSHNTTTKTKKGNSKTTKITKTPRSTFGSNPDPIVLPNGFIDGRSNALAAFEQKCQLLREFRQEFGHCNVPPDPPPKYRRLVNFIVKQRKYYRQLQRKPDAHPQITPERIAVLEEIGLQWYTKKNPMTTWHENYQKLLQIFGKHGHCCLPAIERATLDGDDDDELQKWTREQRRYLKAAKKIHIVDRSGECHQAITEEEESGNFQETNEAASEGPQDNALTRKESDHNESNKNSQENNKWKRNPQSQKRPPFPAYWTPELREKLQAIRCPWLHSFEDDPRAHNLNKNSAFLSTYWYSMLQKFQKFVQQHGTGFLPDTADKRLIEWARDNRRLYDAVQDGGTLDCDEYKTMFQLLERANFVLDREMLRKENERIEQLRLEEAERKRYEESSAGKLEAARKVERAAKDAVEKAKEKASLANKELREVGVHSIVFCLSNITLVLVVRRLILCAFIVFLGEKSA